MKKIGSKTLSIVLLVVLLTTSIVKTAAAQGGTVGEGYLCTASDSRREPQNGVGGIKYSCVLNTDGKYRWTSALAAPPSPVPTSVSTPVRNSTDPAPTSIAPSQAYVETPSANAGTGSSGLQTYVLSNEVQLVVNGVAIKVTPAANGIYFPFGRDGKPYIIRQVCSGKWIFYHCYPVTTEVNPADIPTPPATWLPKPTGYDMINKSWTFAPAGAAVGTIRTIQVASWGSAEVALGSLSIVQPIIIVGCTLNTISYILGDQTAPYEGVPAVPVAVAATTITLKSPADFQAWVLKDLGLVSEGAQGFMYGWLAFNLGWVSMKNSCWMKIDVTIPISWDSNGIPNAFKHIEKEFSSDKRSCLPFDLAKLLADAITTAKGLKDLVQDPDKYMKELQLIIDDANKLIGVLIKAE